MERMLCWMRLAAANWWWPLLLLYLMVDDRLANDEVVPGVVGTLMTNMAVEVALKKRGVEFVRAKVGDR